ncbi:unnamed protein product [Heterosigma akashiwo]|mmetsp:Transcript_9095/g.12734  ORF Transcript_9095/g.12734 Transcript_9095/m.12734 type:complete len:139 (-) Transcript_9095:182-598(-)
MKKRLAFSRLGRDTAHRWAMLRNMVTSLIYHERIQTTVPKAKALKRIADQMITLGKKGNLHAYRQAGAVVQEKPALKKLFAILAPRYTDRSGGYTRLLQLAKPRRGDGADMAIIEYIDRDGELRKPKPGTAAGKATST